MAQNIKNRIFGSDIPKWLKEKLESRQALGKEFNPLESIQDTVGNFGGLSELSSRTPVARMWTALSYFKDVPNPDASELTTEDEINAWWENKVAQENNNIYKSNYLKDMTNGVFKEYEWIQINNDYQKIYTIGNHILNTEHRDPLAPISTDIAAGDEGTFGMAGSDIRQTLPFEQESDGNAWLKPPAGIKSITSETEGPIGAIKKTTVEFSVHNFSDFEKIYLRYFLKPGSQVFIDFGWDTGLLYNPSDLLKNNNYNDYLYGDTGVVTKSKGDLETVFGYVINYDAKIRDDGGFDCSVEIASKNTALFGNGIDESLKDKIIQNIDTDVLKMGIAGVTGDPSFYYDSLASGADADTVDKYNQELMKIAIDAFGGLGVTLPGTYKSKLSSKYGIFVFSPDGLNGSKKTYLNYGWVEDNILNKELGFSDTAADLVNSSKDASTNDDGKFLSKFNSKDSFITYNKSLMTRMKAMELGLDFIYPLSYGSEGQTYNSIRGMVPGRIDEEGELINYNLDDEAGRNEFKKIETTDRNSGVIPVREIFVSTEMIKDSVKNASNPGQFLRNIISRIKEATSGYIELELISTSYGQHTMALGDISINPQQGSLSKESFLEKLLQFNPYSSDTIVKEYDLSFTMPQNGLGNMIAIQSNSNTQNIKPISKLIDGLVAFEKMSATSDDTYVRTLPLTGLDAANRLTAKSTGEESFKFGMGEGSIFSGLTIDKKRKENALMDRLTKSYLGKPEDLYKTHIKNVKDELKQIIKTSYIASGSKARSNTETGKSENQATSTDFNKDSKEMAKKNQYRLVENTDDWFKINFEMETSSKTAHLIPIVANLKIHGISGLTPGDLIRISYLPKNYYDNTYFQITKILHNVGDIWSTSLTTQMRIYPKKIESDRTSKIKIKKTYLQNIGTGGLTDIGILLPFISDLIPIHLETEEKIPIALNKIVYQATITKIPKMVIRDGYDKQQNASYKSVNRLRLPPLPSTIDREDLFEQAIKELNTTFKSNDKSVKLNSIYVDQYDSIGFDLGIFGDWQYKIADVSSTCAGTLREVQLGQTLYIVRSSNDWWIVPENPKNLNKWKTLDNFFQKAQAMPSATRLDDNKSANQTNKDSQNKIIKDVTDTVGDLMDDVTKATGEFIQNASETGIWKKASDFFSWD